MKGALGASDPGAGGHPEAHKSEVMGRRVVAQEITRFVIGGLLAALLVGAGTFIVISRDSEDQAIGHAIDITTVEARGIAQPNLPANLLTEQPADWATGGTSLAGYSLRTFDNLVHTRILNPDVAQGAEVVRVKIWKADGTVVYSDIHQLIGLQFPLGTNELKAIQTGLPDADVSDLTSPENLFERDQGKLLQVYLPIDFQGQKLLFETYQKYDAITQYQQTIWSSFLPVLIGGLLVLLLVQIPLALRLALRVRSSLLEREALLESAIGASERERQHIAQDLHDSVVQDLAATKLSLSTMINRSKSDLALGKPVDITGKLEDLNTGITKAIQGLRTLIVEIAPPNLAVEGLGNAITDLLAPLASKGFATRLEGGSDFHLSEQNTVLLYRVAQEAIRNAIKHSKADSIIVRLVVNGNRARLEVEDDGVGFSDSDLVQRRGQGHLGLTLMKDLVENNGGTFTVNSNSGKGTVVIAEVPQQ